MTTTTRVHITLDPPVTGGRAMCEAIVIDYEDATGEWTWASTSWRDRLDSGDLSFPYVSRFQPWCCAGMPEWVRLEIARHAPRAAA